MRSAEGHRLNVLHRTGPALAAAWLAMQLAGCAGFAAAPAPVEAPPPVVATPLPEEKAEPAAEAAPAPPVVAQAPAAPAAPAVPAEPAPPPIDGATLAAFDEALRMLRANRLPDAERALRALAERQPALAGVHANLGLIYRKTGRLEESVAALQQAIKLSPKQASYHNQLGITWRELGRFDHAVKAYESAIDLDATHAGALINLAILQDLYLGDTARAVELYTRGAALLPAEASTINKWLAELKGRRADPKLAASAPDSGAAAAAAPAPIAPKPAAAPARPTPPRKDKP